MNTALSDIQRATEDFHLQLHLLLDRQGVFQVMQHNLPATPELFLEAQTALINAHTDFARAHQVLLEAHRASLHQDTFWDFGVEDHRPPPLPTIVPETPEPVIPSPPRLGRYTSAGDAVGYTTPPMPAFRRVLFPPQWESPDVECGETLEDDTEEEKIDPETLEQERARYEARHAELVKLMKF